MQTSVKPPTRVRRACGAAPEQASPQGAVVGTSGKRDQSFSPVDFLTYPGLGKKIVEKPEGTRIFSQGDSADCVFYIQKGRVKVSVVSKTGKEAVIAMQAPEEFVGEECIPSGHPVRLTTATALSDCVLLEISRKEMVRVLGQEHALSDVFVSFLLERSARIQSDLVDQLFNSSEKRLARVLLMLAHFGKNGPPETVIPKLSQETLAEIVGTTRSRVSHFMNRFRKMGFVKYDGKFNDGINDGMQIHSSLLNVILHD